jgi:hypothetical protein
MNHRRAQLPAGCGKATTANTDAPAPRLAPAYEIRRSARGRDPGRMSQNAMSSARRGAVMHAPATSDGSVSDDSDGRRRAHPPAEIGRPPVVVQRRMVRRCGA